MISVKFTLCHARRNLLKASSYALYDIHFRYLELVQRAFDSCFQLQTRSPNRGVVAAGLGTTVLAMALKSDVESTHQLSFLFGLLRQQSLSSYFLEKMRQFFGKMSSIRSNGVGSTVVVSVFFTSASKLFDGLNHIININIFLFIFRPINFPPINFFIKEDYWETGC